MFSCLKKKNKKQKKPPVFAVLFLGSLHNVPQHSDSSKLSIHVALGAWVDDGFPAQSLAS